MAEIQIDWLEFIDKYKAHKIELILDRDKIYELFLKSPSAPINWKITFIIVYWLSLLFIPTSIALFFFIKWWIPIVVIFDSFLLIGFIRRIASKAVIAISLKDPVFYSQAVQFKALKINSNEEE